MKQVSANGNWFTWLVFHKDDTQELIRRKKFFLAANIIAIFFLSCLLLTAYFLDVKSFAGYIGMLLACNVLQTILLIILRKWSGWFVYTVFSLYTALIFYIIYRLGGLANSAGLLMAAYFFLLTAQWMEDTRLLLTIGALYLIGLLTVGISYPDLIVDQSLSGWKNNLFFAINYAWIGLLLAVALYATIVKSENEARTRASKLEELDLLKSKMYADIAHEFRTPLTLIRGNAAEIRERHNGRMYEKAGSILHNTDKILHLVNQMLNLSRIEEGAVTLRFVQGDLISFIGSIVESFRGYAESRNIGLHFNPLLSSLNMDMEIEKLEDILSNLLSNAIKFTPAGGEIFVKIDLLKSDNPAGEKVEISIRDTGIGMTEDQLGKIFLRFYRVEDKRSPYRGGSGIGLTLVSEYLKMMNGEIRVTSKVEDGSEFIITLPVTRNAVTEEVVPVLGKDVHLEEFTSEQPDPGEGRNSLPCLLIMEDNRELTDFLSGLLEREYKVLTAADGSQGIKMAMEQIPDIILSDVMMPGKDGYQVCRELKSDFRTNHIPIVLLTARADTASRITGMEQGPDAYLTKPFDKKELMVCMCNLFVQREKLKLKYQSKLFELHKGNPMEDIRDEFLLKVLKVLEQNYRKDKFGAEDLYRVLGISRVQLHRKLTALTGQPATGFIRNFRVRKACRLLLETGKNVAEIAYEVGFADPNYFTRAFTQEHGMTPTEFRKSLT